MEETKQAKIKCVNVDKFFGEAQVLKKVNLECNCGEITGIIGRNGAGKTVLFKILCGLMGTSAGEIYVDGKRKTNGHEILQSVGVIIEEPAFLSNASGLENLEYLYMIRQRNNRKYLKEILERVGLEPDSRKQVEKYSMGMRQRLAIAQAIMENPDILILDEPFNGLDNHGVEDMRKLFLDLKAQGKCILVASHNAEDIRLLCDTVYQMDAGVLEKVR